MSTALYAAYHRQERLRIKRKRVQHIVNHGFTRNIKQKTAPLQIFDSLINQASNENVALSIRIKSALEMREKISRLDVNEVVKLMTTQQLLVVNLAEELLHTPYVPLQQLFFMSLASLLSTLNATRTEETACTRQRFCDMLRHLDKVLLSALPVDKVVEVIDPGRALWTRKQVNALNRSTNVCRTYIVRKCWVSSCGKDKLMPIAVDEWIDFGGTTLTFYQQLARESILSNIPYNCLEAFEFDEAHSLAFVFIKRVLRLDGINLVVFMVEASEFSELRNTLCAVIPEGAKLQCTAQPTMVQRKEVHAKTARSQHRVASNKQLQPQSPVAYKNLPTPPAISPVARTNPPNLHLTCSTKVSARLVRLSDPPAPRTNGVVSDPSTPLRTHQPRIRRVHEETTQVVVCRKVVTAMDRAASVSTPVLRSNRPVRESATITATPREKFRSENVVNASTRSIVAPSHISLGRILWNRVCNLLPATHNELQRRPLLLQDSGTDDLTKAKAECLKNLKESMGYVEPEPIARQFSCLLTFVIAALIVLPWGLLMIQMWVSIV